MANFLLVPVPEITSAETFERYVGGKCLRASSGKAWRDIKAWLIAPQLSTITVPLPAVSELMRRKAQKGYVSTRPNSHE
jgi:hypothetical protein